MFINKQLPIYESVCFYVSKMTCLGSCDLTCFLPTFTLPVLLLFVFSKKFAKIAENISNI